MVVEGGDDGGEGGEMEMFVVPFLLGGDQYVAGACMGVCAHMCEKLLTNESAVMYQWHWYCVQTQLSSRKPACR